MLSVSLFAKKDLFSSPIRVFVGSATIAIGIVASMVCLLLFFIVQHVLGSQYTGTAKTDRSLDIYPKFSIGFLKVTKTEQKPLSHDFLEELEQHPQIEEVFGEETLTYPATLTLSLFNTAFETDSPIYALPDKLFSQYAEQDLKNSSHIPVVISKQLVDLYNLGIAQALGKPQLNEEILRGWAFDIHIGKSSLFQDQNNNNIHRYTGEVVGITDGVTMVGITIPLSDLRKIQGTLAQTPDDFYINKIRVTTKHRDMLPNVQRYVEDNGYDTSSLSKERSATASQVTGIGMAFFTGLTLILILVALSLFLLFWSHVHEKKEIYALLRTQGASTKVIGNILLHQLWILLRTGGLVGVLTGLVVAFFLFQGVQLALGPTLLHTTSYISYVGLSTVYTLIIMVFLGMVTCIFPYFLARRQTPETLLSSTG